MPIPSEDFRPQGVEVIYRRDPDLSILTEHFKEMSPAMRDAVDGGYITFSIREPSKTEVAAVVAHLNNFQIQMASLFKMVGDATKMMGYAVGAAHIDFKNSQIEIPIEMYARSADVKQVKYEVDSLPG